MNSYTQKLLTAIAAYESKCGITEPTSILDALWYDYSCRNPVDDGIIRASEAKIGLVYAELSVEASDSLSDLIVELLESYQRAAYLEGLRMGAHLMQELA